MRLHVLSDLHLECTTLPYRPDPDVVDLADAIVLCGDIGSGAHGIKWASQAFPGKIVLYVHGNHEAYGRNIDLLNADLAQACKGTNVILLDRASHIIGDTRFLGCTLWSDFRLFGDDEVLTSLAMMEAQRGLMDFVAILTDAGSFTPKHALALHQRDLAWLSAELDKPFEGKTVVITHHAPSFRSIEQRYQESFLSPCFASNLDSTVEKADLWIHGHTHCFFDYTIGKCRVVCNPRGYGSISRYGDGEQTGFDPFLVVRP